MDILSAAKRYDMFRPGDRVVVAVSGGPDSVAMLHALYTRRDEFGISLHVAHLNHGIRGEQSNFDQVFVCNLARAYGLEIITARVDVPALRVEMRVGEEEAAREARYAFLQNTAVAIGANKIAVGHTADDRAESVLFNVTRGTGIDGLGSIRPIRGNIVRPLIEAWRSEIVTYVETNFLAFRVDESNSNVAYARNRIRHELIPLLERDFNPRVKEALVRLAKIAADQTELIDDIVGRRTAGIWFAGGLMNVEMFNELLPALQYEVIRREVSRHKGDLRDVSYEQIERVIDALHGDADFTIALPSGRIYAGRKGGEFRIWRKSEPIRVQPFDIPLRVPGTTAIPEIGVAIEAAIEEKPTPRKLPPDEVLIDMDAIRGELRARNMHPGDGITPFGMQGSKKLQDVFTDRKIPRDERARVAIVVDDEKILWVVGVVSSDIGKVTEGTRRAVHLRAGSLES